MTIPLCAAIRLFCGYALGLALASNAAAFSTTSIGAFYPFVIEPYPAASQAPFPQRGIDSAPLPLTAADRIVVRGGNFYRVGQPPTADKDLATADPATPHTTGRDGRRVRFFGVNLSYDANFPSPERARELAATLRAIGVNAVRLHHLDTRLTPQNQEPRGVLAPGPFPEFHEDGVARLRDWIQVLSEHGIYVNLNLRVGYQFRPGIDDVPPFDASGMARPNATPIANYYPPMVAQQKAYATELIARLDLHNNPVLAMVEISNEASLLASWFRGEWQDATPQPYADFLEQAWNAWILAEYGSLATACRHWGNCRNRPESALLLTPQDRSRTLNVGAETLERLRYWWERRRNDDHSATPPEPWLTDRRAFDFARFLADTDAAYFGEMRRTIRQAVGHDVPVTGTQIGYGGPLNFTAMAEMDYYDDHLYVDHPHFPQGHGQQRNWRVWHTSLLGRDQHLLLRHSLRRAWDKPFVVSEYNQPYPSLTGGQMLPLMAVYAARQDWDGLFFYEYANERESVTAPANFALEGDWGKWVQMAQAAHLFQQVAKAPGEPRAIPLAQARQAMFTLNGDLDGLSRYARELTAVTTEGLWQHALGIDLNPPTGLSSTLPTPQAPDNTAIYFDSTNDRFAARGDRWRILIEGVRARPDQGKAQAISQLALRQHGGRPLPISVVLTRADTTESEERWLMTLGSVTVGTQPGSLPLRPKQLVAHPLGSDSWTLEPDPGQSPYPSAPRHASGPAWLPRQSLTLNWQRPVASELPKVYPLDSRGRRLPPLPAERLRLIPEGVQIEVHAEPGEASPWYEWVFAEPTLPPAERAHP